MVLIVLFCSLLVKNFSALDSSMQVFIYYRLLRKKILFYSSSIFYLSMASRVNFYLASLSAIMVRSISCFTYCSLIYLWAISVCLAKLAILDFSYALLFSSVLNSMFYFVPSDIVFKFYKKYGDMPFIKANCGLTFSFFTFLIFTDGSSTGITNRD